MAAVGSYGTGIEIWDLDLIDSVEPAAVLGGPVAGANGAAAKTKKKKGGKKVTSTSPQHVATEPWLSPWHDLPCDERHHHWVCSICRGFVGPAGLHEEPACWVFRAKPAPVSRRESCLTYKLYCAGKVGAEGRQPHGGRAGSGLEPGVPQCAGERIGRQDR